MQSREPAILLGAGAALLLVSGISPHDRFTWFLEVAPILVALPVLLATYRRFPLTPLACRLILLHACILMLMFLCLLGALTAQLTLSRLHDRQLSWLSN